jgi:tripartite-type tricarboxylate transporter receptor subunit TctC
MRKIFTVVLLCLGLAVTCSAAGFPEKPINYIIPFTPGGESDYAAKLQQKELTTILGQPVNIVFKPGAGGALAWAALAKSQPDGYNLTICNLPHIIVQPLAKPTIGFKTEDINVIYIFNSTPNILLVAQDSPFHSLKDLVKYAKDNPSVVTIGGSGLNTANYLGVIELAKASKAKFTYLNYPGSGTALPALLGHSVLALMTSPTMAVSYGNKVRPLAVQSAKRVSSFSNVPTFKEQGYNIIEGTYRGIAVPNGTPAKTMKILEDAFSKINHDPEFRQEMEKLGFKVEDYGIAASKKLIMEKKKHYTEFMDQLKQGAE